MNISKSRYFIAIVPPPPFFNQALQFKNYFRDHYQSKAALNSPPHITLHMPFEWKTEKENELIRSLHEFCQTMNSVSVSFHGFGSFPPRVIFIRVVPSDTLTQLQSALRRYCKHTLGLFNADYKDLPFDPHLTVAFRDLKKSQFIKAWPEFMDRPWDGSFLANQLNLMKHDGKKWQEFHELPFRVS